MKEKLILPILLFSTLSVSASVNISIDTDEDNVPISPYMYGRNGAPASQKEFNLIRESGIRFERMGNGNNCSKYNWRKKITCHPDWYGNVYAADWDKTAQDVQQKLPDVQGMFAFQLIGKVAKTDEYNFDDWGYNRSQWWSGCSKKVVGGGYFDEKGKAVLGDTSLYLQDWPADSTAAIYSHWENDLGIDMKQYQYWNMDNEMEIWGSTHNDVFPSKYNDSIFEDIMQKYFAVAKAIRKINPDVKICGPNAASEWMWFHGAGNVQPTYNGKTYSWLEYFIMRCAEEEKASGVRMIDVLDLHNYPEDDTEAQMLQTHRMYYDREFKYPKANGVKKINGSWDSNIRGEYIFERCREWIEKYFGNDNDIKFGVGEFNIKNSASNMVHALSYASHIGEGCRFGMEYFTPWTWYPSMWEVVHLYSSYAKGISVRAVSSDSALVSAYTSKNTANDSVTIVLVNRAKEEKIVDLDILHTNFPNKQYNTHTLANLPNGDTLTFVSHTDNALKSGLVEINNNHIALSIPPYSITAIELGDGVTNVNEIANGKDNDVIIYPNPAKGILNISSESGICEVDMFNLTGMKVFSINGQGKRNLTLSTSDLTAGSYIVKIISVNGINVKKISILK